MSQLGKLKEKVDRIIAAMGNGLHSGNVEILPFENGNDSACTFCDYKDVCLRNEEDENRVPQVLKNDEIFRKFDGEGDENGRSEVD